MSKSKLISSLAPIASQKRILPAEPVIMKVLLDFDTLLPPDLSNEDFSEIEQLLLNFLQINCGSLSLQCSIQIAYCLLKLYHGSNASKIYNLINLVTKKPNPAINFTTGFIIKKIGQKNTSFISSIVKSLLSQPESNLLSVLYALSYCIKRAIPSDIQPYLNKIYRIIKTGLLFEKKTVSESERFGSYIQITAIKCIRALISTKLVPNNQFLTYFNQIFDVYLHPSIPFDNSIFIIEDTCYSIAKLADSFIHKHRQQHKESSELNEKKDFQNNFTLSKDSSSSQIGLQEALSFLKNFPSPDVFPYIIRRFLSLESPEFIHQHRQLIFEFIRSINYSEITQLTSILGTGFKKEFFAIISKEKASVSQLHALEALCTDYDSYSETAALALQLGEDLPIFADLGSKCYNLAVLFFQNSLVYLSNPPANEPNLISMLHSMAQVAAHLLSSIGESALKGRGELIETFIGKAFSFDQNDNSNLTYSPSDKAKKNATKNKISSEMMFNGMYEAGFILLAALPETLVDDLRWRIDAALSAFCQVFETKSINKQSKQNKLLALAICRCLSSHPTLDNTVRVFKLIAENNYLSSPEAIELILETIPKLDSSFRNIVFKLIVNKVPDPPDPQYYIKNPMNGSSELLTDDNYEFSFPKLDQNSNSQSSEQNKSKNQIPGQVIDQMQVSSTSPSKRLSRKTINLGSFHRINFAGTFNAFYNKNINNLNNNNTNNTIIENDDMGLTNSPSKVNGRRRRRSSSQKIDIDPVLEKENQKIKIIEKQPMVEAIASLSKEDAFEAVKLLVKADKTSFLIGIAQNKSTNVFLPGNLDQLLIPKCKTQITAEILSLWAKNDPNKLSRLIDGLKSHSDVGKAYIYASLASNVPLTIPLIEQMIMELSEMARDEKIVAQSLFALSTLISNYSIQMTNITSFFGIFQILLNIIHSPIALSPLCQCYLSHAFQEALAVVSPDLSNVNLNTNHFHSILLKNINLQDFNTNGNPNNTDNINTNQENNVNSDNTNNNSNNENSISIAPDNNTNNDNTNNCNTNNDNINNDNTNNNNSNNNNTNNDNTNDDNTNNCYTNNNNSNNNNTNNDNTNNNNTNNNNINNNNTNNDNPNNNNTNNDNPNIDNTNNNNTNNNNTNNNNTNNNNTNNNNTNNDNTNNDNTNNDNTNNDNTNNNNTNNNNTNNDNTNNDNTNIDNTNNDNTNNDNTNIDNTNNNNTNNNNTNNNNTNNDNTNNNNTNNNINNDNNANNDTTSTINGKINSEKIESSIQVKDDIIVSARRKASKKRANSTDSLKGMIDANLYESLKLIIGAFQFNYFPYGRQIYCTVMRGVFAFVKDLAQPISMPLSKGVSFGWKLSALGAISDMGIAIDSQGLSLNLIDLVPSALLLIQRTDDQRAFDFIVHAPQQPNFSTYWAKLAKNTVAQGLLPGTGEVKIIPSSSAKTAVLMALKSAILEIAQKEQLRTEDLDDAIAALVEGTQITNSYPLKKVAFDGMSIILSEFKDKSDNNQNPILELYDAQFQSVVRNGFASLEIAGEFLASYLDLNVKLDYNISNNNHNNSKINVNHSIINLYVSCIFKAISTNSSIEETKTLFLVTTKVFSIGKRISEICKAQNTSNSNNNNSNNNNSNNNNSNNNNNKAYCEKDDAKENQNQTIIMKEENDIFEIIKPLGIEIIGHFAGVLTEAMRLWSSKEGNWDEISRFRTIFSTFYSDLVGVFVWLQYKLQKRVIKSDVLTNFFINELSTAKEGWRQKASVSGLIEAFSYYCNEIPEEFAIQALEKINTLNAGDILRKEYLSSLIESFALRKNSIELWKLIGNTIINNNEAFSKKTLTYLIVNSPEEMIIELSQGFVRVIGIAIIQNKITHIEGLSLITLVLNNGVKALKNDQTKFEQYNHLIMEEILKLSENRKEILDSLNERCKNELIQYKVYSIGKFLNMDLENHQYQDSNNDSIYIEYLLDHFYEGGVEILVNLLKNQQLTKYIFQILHSHKSHENPDEICLIEIGKNAENDKTKLEQYLQFLRFSINLLENPLDELVIIGSEYAMNILKNLEMIHENVIIESIKLLNEINQKKEMDVEVRMKYKALNLNEKILVNQRLERVIGKFKPKSKTKLMNIGDGNLRRKKRRFIDDSSSSTTGLEEEDDYLIQSQNLDTE